MIIKEFEKQLNNSKQDVNTKLPKKVGEFRDLCTCVDWRDMQSSPFCHKCNGKG